MGVAYLPFLYHRYSVIIHRGAPHNQSKCLESAHQALFLLQDISLDTESVYDVTSWYVTVNESLEGNSYISRSHHSS